MQLSTANPVHDSSLAHIRARSPRSLFLSWSSSTAIGKNVANLVECFRESMEIHEIAFRVNLLQKMIKICLDNWFQFQEGIYGALYDWTSIAMLKQNKSAYTIAARYKSIYCYPFLNPSIYDVCITEHCTFAMETRNILRHNSSLNLLL